MTSNPAQGKRRRTKANSWLLAYKEKLGCQICGYKKHPEILVVHHKELVRRNRNKKNLSGSFVSGMTSIKRMKGSLKKCLILCPNCHAWVHYKDNQFVFLRGID